MTDKGHFQGERRIEKLIYDLINMLIIQNKNDRFAEKIIGIIERK